MRTAKAKATKLVKETKKSAQEHTLLPLDIIIEVVAQNDEQTIIKEMSYGAWLKLPRNENFRYSAFQKGFAMYPDAIRK